MPEGLLPGPERRGLGRSAPGFFFSITLSSLVVRPMSNPGLPDSPSPPSARTCRGSRENGTHALEFHTSSWH